MGIFSFSISVYGFQKHGGSPRYFAAHGGLFAILKLNLLHIGIPNFLRHFCGSFLANNGVRREVIEEILGIMILGVQKFILTLDRRRLKMLLPFLTGRNDLKMIKKCLQIWNFEVHGGRY